MIEIESKRKHTHTTKLMKIDGRNWGIGKGFFIREVVE